LKIVAALANELNGKIVYQFGAEGALAILRFPVNGEAAQIQGNRVKRYVTND
jgi:hypothetical protein